MYFVFCDLVFTLIYMIYVFCAFSCAYMCLAPNEKESWCVLPKLGDMSTKFSYFMDSWSYLTYPIQFWLVLFCFLQWTINHVHTFKNNLPNSLKHLAFLFS